MGCLFHYLQYHFRILDRRDGIPGGNVDGILGTGIRRQAPGVRKRRNANDHCHYYRLFSRSLSGENIHPKIGQGKQLRMRLLLLPHGNPMRRES
jgi:hypothetical protein